MRLRGGVSSLNDKISGYLILVGSLLGIGLYFYLVLLSPWVLLVIQISAFGAVTGMLAIMAWIGYTLATTPAPMPLEDFDVESLNEVEKDEDAEI